MARNYLSGKGTRLWLKATTNDSNAPFSSSATFSPSYVDAQGTPVALGTASAQYIGNFLGAPDLKYGPNINPTHTAECAGAEATVEGVENGDCNFQVQHDAENPIGDKVVSGTLYDFVITYNFTVPTAAANNITGRIRVGQVTVPSNLNGDNIVVSIAGKTHGKVYGDVIGRANS